MRILAAINPTTAYINVLLASVVYWIKRDEGLDVTDVTKEFKHDWLASIRPGAAFCRDHNISALGYQAYNKLLLHRPDPDAETLQNALADHLRSLYKAMPELRKDPSITDAQLKLINTIRLWHNNRSDSALAAIRAAIGKLGVPGSIMDEFRIEQVDVAPLLDRIRRVVKQLTGKAGLHVPLEMVAELRDANPELWKRYLEARKQLNVIYKEELRDFVRQRGGNVDVDDARSYLKSRGIPSRLPEGFVGKVGEDGNLLTKNGHPLKTGVGGDVVNLDPAAKIVMNPDYDPANDKAGVKGNWVFKAVLPTKKAGSDRNNEQYFYTGDKHLENRSKKFGLVEELLKNERRMVTAWRADLLGKNLERSIVAAQCELAYETCARIGGKDNMNRNGQTYGLTTLLVGNVKRRGQDIILDYIGKDSVRQRHVLKPETPVMRKIIAIIKMLAEDQPRRALLWEHDGVEYNAARLRAYFRKVSGVAEASPHKLRHLRGTRLARTALDEVSVKLKAKRKIDQRTVDAAFKEAMTTVGSILGHVKGVGAEQKTVWTTAAKNYVDPSVMDEFYEQWRAAGVRPPGFIAKLRG